MIYDIQNKYGKIVEKSWLVWIRCEDKLNSKTLSSLGQRGGWIIPNLTTLIYRNEVTWNDKLNNESLLSLGQRGG